MVALADTDDLQAVMRPDGLPVFQYKTLIPVTGLFMLFQGIVEVIRCEESEASVDDD